MSESQTQITSKIIFVPRIEIYSDMILIGTIKTSREMEPDELVEEVRRIIMSMVPGIDKDNFFIDENIGKIERESNGTYIISAEMGTKLVTIHFVIQPQLTPYYTYIINKNSTFELYIFFP